MERKSKIAVIGSGLGGLSAAVRLSGKGYDVHIYEKSDKPGGKAASLSSSGYRFDTGPSVLTMVFVLEQLFQEAGENIRDYLTISPLEIICRYFYSDGTVLNAYADFRKLEKELKEKAGLKESELKNYFDYCRRIYDLTAELFLFKSLGEISTFLNAEAFKTLLNIKKIDSFRSMNEANSAFFSSSKLVQMFNRYATYNGSNPFLAPATLNIIPHVEYSLGSYFIEEGIFSIPAVLAKIAEKKGAKFYYGSSVEKIVYKGNRITGIRVNGEEKEYSTVISNSDVNYTYKKLLEDDKSRFARQYESHEPSTSAIVFCWGIRKQFRHLQAHNILFSADYGKEFSELFERQACPHDPTVYIHISSKYRPEDAPEGCENWFVMVNAPYNNGKQDWEAEKKRQKEIILKKISTVLGTEIEPLIETEKIFTPVDIEANTLSYRGSIYGISSNSRYSAFLRQSNRSRKYKGLYFAGGSAHPGGGIPLVLLSGRIVSGLIEKRLKK